MGETLKVKVPIIGKGPFTVKLNKDDPSVTALDERFKINEIDGTVTVTLLSD